MPLMPDLMNALTSLQLELDRGGLIVNPCALDLQYKMIFDQPNGEGRFTYAKVIDGEVLALANFVLAEPIDGVPCFNVGYAVKPNHRGQGLGVEAVSVGIEELKNGFGQTHRGKSFYVEAIVEVSNQLSIKVAERLFSGSGEPIIDAPSGKPALHFKKIVQF